MLCLHGYRDRISESEAGSSGPIAYGCDLLPELSFFVCWFSLRYRRYHRYLEFQSLPHTFFFLPSAASAPTECFYTALLSK